MAAEAWKSSSTISRGNRRMAAGANEPSEFGIQLDTAVLGFMAYGSIPEGLTHPQLRRIIRRAKGGVQSSSASARGYGGASSSVSCTTGRTARYRFWVTGWQ